MLVCVVPVLVLCWFVMLGCCAGVCCAGVCCAGVCDAGVCDAGV